MPIIPNDSLGKFVLLIPETLGSIGVEVLIPNMGCTLATRHSEGLLELYKVWPSGNQQVRSQYLGRDNLPRSLKGHGVAFIKVGEYVKIR